MASIAHLSPARAVTDGETVLASIDIPASPRQLFDALTTEELERWWGSPSTYCMHQWRADLRVGGEWHVNVCLPDGVSRPADGKFLAIDAPHSVTLTRRYNWDHPAMGRAITRVTYRFNPAGNATRVTVRHDGFNTPAAAEEHAAGWERVLEWLREHFAAVAPS